MNNQPCIYVLDDDEFFLNEVVISLHDSAVAVIPFNETRLFFDKLERTENYPVAILLDFTMTPEMSGAEVVEKLKREYKYIPIIICTGKDKRSAAFSYGSGIYAVIMKPLDVYELSVIVHELSKRDELFQKMADDVLEITKVFDSSLVWQLDKKKYTYKVVAWKGAVDRSYHQAVTLPYDALPWVVVEKRRRPFYRPDVLDLQANPAYLERDEAAKRGWRSLLTVPLVKSGRVLGWIDCYSSQVDVMPDPEFRAQLNELLDKYAQQASSAVYSEMLTRQLRIIQEITQQLSWVSTEEKVFKTILEKAEDYLGYSFAWIHKYNFLTTKIVLGGFSPAENKDISNKQANSFLEQQVIDKVVTEKKTERIRRCTLKMNTLEDAITVQSAVYVPIKRADKHLLGILTVSSIRKDFFTLEDLQFLHSLAATAAVVIDQVKSNLHLKEISKLGQEDISEADLTQYVVNAARDLTHADVAFWKLSPEENEGDKNLRIASFSGDFSQDFIKRSVIPNDPARSSNAKVLHTGETITIANIHELEPGEIFYHGEEFYAKHWHSFMAIPLLSKNKDHLGVLSLYGKEINEFSDVGKNLIEHFAFQTALALQERKHIVLLQKLSKIGQELTIDLPGTKQLLQNVVNLGLDISNSDITVLYPFDNRSIDKFDLRAVTFAGKPKNKHKKLAERPKEDGVTSMTINHGMLIFEDSKNDEGVIRAGLDKAAIISPSSQEYSLIRESIQKSRFLEQENIGSFIGVALRAAEIENTTKQPVVGVLYFNYRAPRNFDAELIRVLDIFARQTANIIYRNRLIEDIHKQNALMQAVNQASLRIGEQANPQEQLYEIIRSGIQLLDAKGGKIYKIINGNQKDAYLAAGINLPRGVKEKQIIPYDHGMVGQVIHTKKAFYCNDYARFPKHIPAFEQLFSAVVEAPLIRKDEIIGVLSIFADSKERQFSEEDATTLETLALHASAAMYNSDLHQELELSYQAGLRLHDQEDLASVAYQILKELNLAIDFDKATIQLISSPSRPRYPLAIMGYPKKLINHDLLGAVNEDPLILEIYQKKSPLILSDTHDDPRWSQDIPEIQDVRSWACIPLIDQNEVFGFITIDHAQPGYYQAKDLGRLQRFSPQASIALRRVNLLEQIRDQKAIFEDVIAEITKGIADSTGTDVIYESVTRSAINIFGGIHLAEIYLLEKGRKKIKRLTRYGVAKNKSGYEIDISKGLLAKVLEQGKATLLEDVEKYPDFQEVVNGTCSAILAPIKQNGEIIGFLNIEHPEINGLEESDVRMAEALCNLVAITKEKADLLRQLSLMESFLNAVREVDALDTRDGVDAVFAILTKTVLKINADQTIGCRFYMEDKKFFSLQELRHAVRANTQRINLSKLQLGVGYIGQVYQTGVATLIGDVNEIKDTELGKRTKSLALVPIWSGGLTIGLLALEGKQPFAFNDFELNVLKALVLLSENKIYEFDQHRKQQEAFKRKFNPYIVGGAIEDPNLFFGREKLAKAILNGIHNNHYFIQGVRRIGKSSLIRHLIRRLSFQDDFKYQFFPVLFDLQNVNNGGFFVHFIRRVIRDLDLIDTITLPDVNRTFDHYDFQDLLDQVLAILWARAKGKQVRIVAFIDEIQKINRLGEGIPEQLRAILMEKDQLKLIMTGVRFFHQPESDTSPFNIHLTIELDALEEEEARRLIIDPVQSIYSYDEDAIDLILRASELEPRNVQFLCHEAIHKLYEMGFDEKKPIINRQHVELNLNALAKLKYNKHPL